MARRRFLGCVATVALTAGAWTACKDKAGDSRTQGSASVTDQRCEHLARACGDTDKHIQKLADECEQAHTKQADPSCAAKTNALYDCYEKELCGKADKVWTLEDLGLLSGRHGKCAAEQEASRTCTTK